jgi:peptidyl-prolyl cis-trans isomerase SurA
MNKRFPILTLLSGLFCLLLGLPAAAADYAEVDRIVAVVDDGVVVRSELDTELRKVILQLQEKGTEVPPRRQLEELVLERLISKKLQLAAAARSGIKVSDEMVAKAVGSLAQGNKLSLAQLREVLAKDGVDFRDFQEDLRAQLTIKQLVETEVVRRIQVSDQEVEGYLARFGGGAAEGRKEYRLSHILIATKEAADPALHEQARDKAERLVQELRGGADFRALAIANSAGQQAMEGGDLGWRDAEQIPTLFAEAVAKMQQGEIAGPVKSSSGYHIIRLEAVRSGGQRELITQTHARHILIRTGPTTSDDDARGRLEQMRQRIQTGEDFANLARAQSEDKGSATRGGDLGWLSPGDTVPPFEAEMDRLEPGKLSAPFRTDFGWHMVEVLERRQRDGSGDMRKAEALRAIRAKKAEEEVELYLRRLRSEAYVEIRLEGRGA